MHVYYAITCANKIPANHPGFPGIIPGFIPLSRYPGNLRLYPGSLVRVNSRRGCGVCAFQLLPKARVMREAYIRIIHVRIRTCTYVRTRSTAGYGIDLRMRSNFSTQAVCACPVLENKSREFSQNQGK